MERQYQQTLIQWKVMNLELANPNLAGFVKDGIKTQNRLYIILAASAFFMGLFLIFLPPIGAAWIISGYLIWTVRKSKKQAAYSIARLQEDQATENF